MADLAALFDDLQCSLACCERLIAELDGPADAVALEAFWTTAVISYGRCFSPGKRGVGLTEDDITATKLEGDVLGWHKALLQIRDLYAGKVNPREAFTVGAAPNDFGKAEGVALSSMRRPPVDDISVRQTGAIAYALCGIIDARIAEQQQVVFTAAAALRKAELAKLPVLEVVSEEPTPVVPES
ncbi:MAG: hypothetical protein H0T85_00095 [Geodermatophilaceae bacterium]|nr:hypothetical protein [Geodermatophilaceae bacterium]